MTDSDGGVKEAAGLAPLRAYAEAKTAARLRVAERWHTGVLIRDVSRIPGSQPIEFYAVLIRKAVERTGHNTEFFAWAARCSLAEAVVVLQRLESEGLVARGMNGYGMTWKAT